MEGSKEREVIVSDQFLLDLDEIFEFGLQTFGVKQAESYEANIWDLIENLSHNYLLFPECRHLPTKSKMYRWIILDAHVIIYRLSKSHVQVLRIIHSHKRITEMKSAKKINV